MSNEPTEQTTGKTAGETPVAGRRRIGLPIAVLAVCTVAAIAITWLLTTIFTHKQEYKSPFTEVVTIDETVVDPAVWGRNFPLQYESYKLTAEMPESEKAYRTPTEADPRTFTAKSKIEADPRLVTMWQSAQVTPARACTPWFHVSKSGCWALRALAPVSLWVKSVKPTSS